jgi:hypothetical protein
MLGNLWRVRKLNIVQKSYFVTSGAMYNLVKASGGPVVKAFSVSLQSSAVPKSANSTTSSSKGADLLVA